MMFCYGFGFIYLGTLAWHFDLNLSRFGFSDRSTRLGSIVFVFIGAMFALIAAIRSRAGLIKDVRFLSKSIHEIDSSKPDITPEQRVNRLRDKPNG